MTFYHISSTEIVRMYVDESNDIVYPYVTRGNKSIFAEEPPTLAATGKKIHLLKEVSPGKTIVLRNGFQTNYLAFLRKMYSSVVHRDYILIKTPRTYMHPLDMVDQVIEEVPYYNPRHCPAWSAIYAEMEIRYHPSVSRLRILYNIFKWIERTTDILWDHSLRDIRDYIKARVDDAEYILASFELHTIDYGGPIYTITPKTFPFQARCFYSNPCQDFDDGTYAIVSAETYYHSPKTNLEYLVIFYQYMQLYLSPECFQRYRQYVSCVFTIQDGKIDLTTKNICTQDENHLSHSLSMRTALYLDFLSQEKPLIERMKLVHT